MPLEELLAQVIAWEDTASIGDAGERPSFDIDRTNGRWEVWACSFYDGGGRAHGDDLEECIASVLNEIRSQPEKEKERELDSVVSAVARYRRISTQRAKALVEESGIQDEG